MKARPDEKNTTVVIPSVSDDYDAEVEARLDAYRKSVVEAAAIEEANRIIYREQRKKVHAHH